LYPIEGEGEGRERGGGGYRLLFLLGVGSVRKEVGSGHMERWR